MKNKPETDGTSLLLFYTRKENQKQQPSFVRKNKIMYIYIHIWQKIQTFTFCRHFCASNSPRTLNIKIYSYSSNGFVNIYSIQIWLIYFYFIYTIFLFYGAYSSDGWSLGVSQQAMHVRGFIGFSSTFDLNVAPVSPKEYNCGINLTVHLSFIRTRRVLWISLIIGLTVFLVIKMPIAHIARFSLLTMFFLHRSFPCLFWKWNLWIIKDYSGLIFTIKIMFDFF